MIRNLFIVTITIATISCSSRPDTDSLREEVFQTEKAFEKMAAEEGVAAAFYTYADENAVIKRGEDQLISGKENIRQYYTKQDNGNASVTWTPDFVEVSESGDMAYTYGKYVWRIKTDSGINEYPGIFHTVWKRQPDKSWKYVWD